MDQSTLISELDTALGLFATMTGPPLAVALIVGLVVGLLQAATQIQDQTLPLTFKVVAVCATMLLGSQLIFPPLLSYTERVFDQFPALTQN